MWVVEDKYSLFMLPTFYFASLFPGLDMLQNFIQDEVCYSQQIL